MIHIISAMLFVAVFIIAAKLLEGLLIRSSSRNILANSANLNSALPSALASSVLPRGRIFRSLALPIPGKDGEEIHLGTVIVSRSGIFILCLINGSGIIENPPSGNWKHISNGKCSEFQNPFLAQKDARGLIEYLAEQNGLSGLHAYSLVIFTGTSLKFTHPRSRGVISASELTDKLCSLEKRGKLTRTQVRAAATMLRNADAY